MTDFLIESGLRANRPAIVNSMMRSAWNKYERDIKTMADLADNSKWFSILLISPLLTMSASYCGPQEEPHRQARLAEFHVIPQRSQDRRDAF